MAVQAIDRDFPSLHRTFTTARRWLWWQTAIRAVARGLCGSLGFALAAALLAAWQAPTAFRAGFWAAGAVSLLLGLAAAVALRPSRSQAARAVDHRLGLRQELGTAEELLSKGARGNLVTLQLARTSELAGELPIARAFPLVPRRELSFGLLLALATASTLVLVSLGYLLPNPLAALHFPSFTLGAATAPQQEVLGIRREGAGVKSRSPALDSVRQSLADLQAGKTTGLSASAAAAALAQASGELNRVANESRVQQQAMDTLAKELRNTPSGQDVANSLLQGDYDKAAQQLEDLGRQSDQLSPSAKKELAQALNRAAANSQNAENLSGGESKAARALQQGDYSSVVQSMSQLAGAVKDSSYQMVPQSELADTWQQLEQLSRQFGGQASQNGQSNSALSAPVAQAPGTAGEKSMNLQQGPGDTPGSNGGPTGSQMGTQGGPMPGGSGEPGSQPGGPPLGAENPRLGPDGKPLTVDSKIGDRFPGDNGSGSQPPSVLRQGTANSIPSSQDQGASGPLSVPAENLLVPGDRRPIVREYFSKGSGNQ